MKSNSTYCQLQSHVTQKLEKKIKNPAKISFGYCALIKESVVICQPPLLMGEEIAFENGRISDFQGLVTLTFNRVMLHTVMHHSSPSAYIPNFIEIGRKILWRITTVVTANFKVT